MMLDDSVFRSGSCPTLAEWGHATTFTPAASLRQAYEGSSVLGKRDADGAPRIRKGTTRSGSRYRGVTHHARTNRYEAHLWDDGKQLYLGGFYNEEQAALAYDLAAVRFRGEEAVTNFPLEDYHGELAARREVTREQVVACLRDQSKAMNKVEAGAGAGRMEPWELALSAALHVDFVHFGLYGTELEAARAYDRAIVGAQGVEASQQLNFPLVDYLDMLGPEQRMMGMERGLLPASLPSTYAPSAVPQPLHDSSAAMLAMLSHLPPLGSPEEAGRVAYGFGAAASEAVTSAAATGRATPQQQVPRRKSITPRSVLDFDDFQAAQKADGAAAAAKSDADGSPVQSPADYPDMEGWVNALAL